MRMSMPTCVSPFPNCIFIEKTIESHLAESRDQGCSSLRASPPSGHMLHSSTPASSPGHRREFNPPSGLGFPPVCVHSFVCVCVCVQFYASSSCEASCGHDHSQDMHSSIATWTSPVGLSSHPHSVPPPFLLLRPGHWVCVLHFQIRSFSFKSDAPASIPKCYIDGCTQYAAFQD